MSGKIAHLSWGIVLMLFFVMLYTMHLPLVRLSDSLRPSQTFALQFVGECLSLVPFVCIIGRHWSLKSRKEWLVVGFQCLILAASVVAKINCALNIPLGTLKFLFKRILSR